MHHAARVEVSQRGQEAPGDRAHHRGRQRPVRGQEIAQRAAVHELHDQAQVVVGILEAVEDLDQAGMVAAEREPERGLLEEQRDQARVHAEIGAHVLAGHGRGAAIASEALGLVDHGHAAVAEVAHAPVRAGGHRVPSAGGTRRPKTSRARPVLRAAARVEP